MQPPTNTNVKGSILVESKRIIELEVKLEFIRRLL